MIPRFLFDALGAATFNGSFASPADGLHDLQFFPSTLQVAIDIKPGSDSQ